MDLSEHILKKKSTGHLNGLRPHRKNYLSYKQWPQYLVAYTIKLFQKMSILFPELEINQFQH